MTLLDLFRSSAAFFNTALIGQKFEVLDADQAIAIHGGMPAPDPAQSSNEGDEGGESNKANEDDEGD